MGKRIRLTDTVLGLAERRGEMRYRVAMRKTKRKRREDRDYLAPAGRSESFKDVVGAVGEYAFAQASGLPMRVEDGKGDAGIDFAFRTRSDLGGRRFTINVKTRSLPRSYVERSGEEGLWLCVPRWLWRFHHADIYVLAWCPDRNDLSEVELVGCISRARFGAERLFTESMGNRGVATYYVEASSLTPIEALLGRIKETRDDEEE